MERGNAMRISEILSNLGYSSGDGAEIHPPNLLREERIGEETTIPRKRDPRMGEAHRRRLLSSYYGATFVGLVRNLPLRI